MLRKKETIVIIKNAVPFTVRLRPLKISAGRVRITKTRHELCVATRVEMKVMLK